VLSTDDLLCPGNDELDATRAEVMPKPHGRTKKTATRSAARFERLGIGPFFPENSDAQLTIALLRQPRARELIEAGLIVGVPAGAIVKTLAVHLKSFIRPTVVELYRDTFFDVSAVTRAQLRILVSERVRLSVARAMGGRHDEAAVRWAVESDARTIATTLPATPMAWAAVLLSLGHSPGRHELADVIEQMEGLAAVRLGEALLRGGLDDERRAEGYISVLQKIRMVKETVSTPDRELARQLSVLHVRHDAKPQLTLEELRARGDEHTVDMGPPRVVEDEKGT
jgi:hypothetical protein